jgi:hypothetical protein
MGGYFFQAGFELLDDPHRGVGGPTAPHARRRVLLFRIADQVEELWHADPLERRDPAVFSIELDFPVLPFHGLESVGHEHRKPSRADSSTLA